MQSWEIIVEVTVRHDRYEWRLSPQDLRVVRMSMLFLRSELPESLFFDYTGVTVAESVALDDRLVGPADVVSVLTAREERVIRAHMSLSRERMSDRSFEDWVGVTKPDAASLESALGFLGHAALQSATLDALAADGFLAKRMEQNARDWSGLDFGDLMAVLQRLAVDRCHAIEFGQVREEVLLRSAGSALVELIESRPRPRRVDGPIGEWLLNVGSAGVVDFGFVVAEHYVFGELSTGARTLLTQLTARTSRPNLLYALRALLFASETNGD